MSKNHQLPIAFSFFFVLCSIQYLKAQNNNLVQENKNIAERIPYNIPLSKLSLMKEGTAVKVSKNGGDNDYAIIALFDDLFAKVGRDQTTRTTYREYANQAHYMSDFEARILLAVSESLSETLEDFERNLQQKKWGHCLYLDAFLPKFLRNYYMLIAISRNNTSKYDDKICLFENKFEVSLRSKQSDERISNWNSNNEHIMKLRIASKELAHQLRLWQKRELSNKNRNPEVSLASKVEENLELFIKVYFIIKGTSNCQSVSQSSKELVDK